MYMKIMCALALYTAGFLIVQENCRVSRQQSNLEYDRVAIMVHRFISIFWPISVSMFGIIFVMGLIFSAFRSYKINRTKKELETIISAAKKRQQEKRRAEWSSQVNGPSTDCAKKETPDDV